MKIFKFKDLRNLSNHSHFLQIIQENKIWCAAPGSLNDEREFDFNFNYKLTEDTHNLLSKVIEKYGRLNISSYLVASHGLKDNKLEEITESIRIELIEQCRESIGVSSFSTVGSSDWLWSEYGGHGNGVRIEFELPNDSVGQTFHIVDYVPQKIFHIDVFLKSHLTNAEEVFRRILCTKTRKWQDEQEIRFIGKRPNVSFVMDARISNVTFGSEVPSNIRDQLTQICREKSIDVQNQITS